MKKGIDVSEWNGRILWDKVKGDGVEFVWVRSSYGAAKSLAVYTDKMFTANSEAALLQGLSVSPYHFSTLNSFEVEKDATLEAEFFLQRIQAFPFNFNPVLDLESNALDLRPDEVFKWVKTFRDIIEQKIATKLFLYSYTPFLNQVLPQGIDMPLWLAQYPRDISKGPVIPTGWNKLEAWQYSAKGKVNGISTDVDMNQIYV